MSSILTLTPAPRPSYCASVELKSAPFCAVAERNAFGHSSGCSGYRLYGSFVCQVDQPLHLTKHGYDSTKQNSKSLFIILLALLCRAVRTQNGHIVFCFTTASIPCTGVSKCRGHHHARRVAHVKVIGPRNEFGPAHRTVRPLLPFFCWSRLRLQFPKPQQWTTINAQTG